MYLLLRFFQSLRPRLVIITLRISVFQRWFLLKMQSTVHTMLYNLTSLTTGMTTDVDSYMFGSILAMDRADVALSVGLSVAVLALFVLFYHRLFAITFDESFSRATGVKVGLYNTLLSVLTALTIVLGMRMMGAMLISSLVIFPALSAMRVLKSFRGVVICSGCISVASFCVGLTSSYLLGTPVGASVVLVDLAVFLVCCGITRVKKAN